MEISLTCLYFSLCQDNAFLLTGSASSEPLVLVLNTVCIVSLKIADFSTHCGAFSAESKLQELTVYLPQRCCVTENLWVSWESNDMPQIWMGELERKFHMETPNCEADFGNQLFWALTEQQMHRAQRNSWTITVRVFVRSNCLGFSEAGKKLRSSCLKEQS